VGALKACSFDKKISSSVTGKTIRMSSQAGRSTRTGRLFQTCGLAAVKHNC